MWETGECAHRVLVRRPERKETLGRPRSRWDDNIKNGCERRGIGRHDFD